MWYFNLALTKFFDLLLTPFQSFHPFWSLSVFSLFTGILMLVIFRYTSDQKGIREAKERIKAHLIEIRLFKDNLGILLSAQKNILFYNAQYLKHAVKPTLFMLVPVAMILIHMDNWFSHRPLTLGEATVVSVEALDKENLNLSHIKIEVDKGLEVETPPLRIPEAGEVNWRISASELGEHNVIVSVPGHTFQKKVLVSDRKLTRVSPRMVTSGFWETLMNPGEDPIPEEFMVKRIEVEYPSRSIELFGWRIHWLVVFFILSVSFGLLLKGFLRVEI